MGMKNSKSQWQIKSEIAKLERELYEKQHEEDMREAMESMQKKWFTIFRRIFKLITGVELEDCYYRQNLEIGEENLQTRAEIAKQLRSEFRNELIELHHWRKLSDKEMVVNGGVEVGIVSEHSTPTEYKPKTYKLVSKKKTNLTKKPE